MPASIVTQTGKASLSSLQLPRCVQMPAVQDLKTPEYLRQLQRQGTDQSRWEVGASCNFLIAAARLGMCTSAVANLGQDVYGQYLLDILQVGVPRHRELFTPVFFLIGPVPQAGLDILARPTSSTEGSGWEVEQPCCAQREGVKHFQPLAPTAFNEALRETLLCFVLVDPSSAHAFCSRYDFGPWPLLPGVDSLPAGVHKVSLP